MDTKRNMPVYFVLSAFFLFMVVVSDVFAASADAVKDEAIRKPSTPNTTRSIPERDTTTRMRTQGVAGMLPSLVITSFKKKVEVAPGTMAMRVNPNAPAPTSAQINYGDEITLAWTITFRNVTAVQARINGIGPVNLGTPRTASNGTTYYTGQVTVRPRNSTAYQLIATARPTSSNVRGTPQANKTFRVILREPAFNILQPEVDDGTLQVQLSVRNSGLGDFRPTPIQVSYEVYGNVGGRNAASIASGSFTTDRIGIEHGHRASLGSIDLSSFRDRLYSYPAMSIRLRVGASYVLPLRETSESFRHTWEAHTITINQGALDLLAPVTTCDVRLNNYNPSNPRIPLANDSYVQFNMMGMGGDPVRFSIPRQVYAVRVTGRLTGHAYVDEQVLVLINQIEASGASTGLLSIRNGKLGIHLNFPNSGNSEIKLGTLADRHFDDGEVPDLNIGSFTVDAWLTPTLRDNHISYSNIDVEVPTVSASLHGRFDGLNPLIRRYLSDYVTSAIRSQLNSIFSSDTVKTAIENGLANAVNLGSRQINRLVSVRGSGDSIIITYR